MSPGIGRKKLKKLFLDKEVVLIGDENDLTIIVPIGRFTLFCVEGNINI